MDQERAAPRPHSRPDLVPHVAAFDYSLALASYRPAARSNRSILNCVSAWPWSAELRTKIVVALTIDA